MKHLELIIYDEQPPRIRWFYGETAEKDLAKKIEQLPEHTRYRISERIKGEWVDR